MEHSLTPMVKEVKLKEGKSQKGFAYFQLVVELKNGVRLTQLVDSNVGALLLPLVNKVQ